MRARILLVALLIASALPARAASITWVFEGRVENREFRGPPFPPPVETEQFLTSLGVVPGALVSGSVTFESGTPDAASNAEVGQY